MFSYFSVADCVALELEHRSVLSSVQVDAHFLSIAAHSGYLWCLRTCLLFFSVFFINLAICILQLFFLSLKSVSKEMHQLKLHRVSQSLGECVTERF